MAGRRAACGSSRAQAARLSSSSRARPSSRRRQRSSPPTTAASTSRRCHCQGARGASDADGSGGAASGSADAGSRSAACSGGRHDSTCSGGAPSAPGGGTCAMDRYSANRRADSRSAAQERSASSARPLGSGVRVPRANHAGVPARLSAVSSGAAYTCGARTRIAMRSSGMPPADSFRTARAISTHSRPSPGAEKNTTSPSPPGAAGCGGVSAVNR